MAKARPMFMPAELLLVPNVFWQVTHDFVELSKGPVISPPGFPEMRLGVLSAGANW
jgi:hypothetical protein